LSNFVCVILLLHSCTKNKMTWDLVQLIVWSLAVALFAIWFAAV